MTTAVPRDQLELLARLPGDVLTLMSPDGRCHYVTPAVERTMGYRPDDYLEAVGLGMIHPDDRELAIAEWLHVVEAEGNEARFEIRCRHADGSWRWLKMILVNRLADPTIGGVVGNFRDVTERRELEDRLKVSEERIQTVLRHAAEVFLIVGPDLTISWSSPAIDPVLGYQPEQVLGRPVLDYLHPDDLDVALTRLAVLVDGNQVGEYTLVRARHADETWRWIEVDGTDMSSDPLVGGVLLSFRDVTPRVRAERELARSEQRLVSLVEHAPAVIDILDEDGVVRWMSSSARRIIGWEPDDVIGRPAEELIHPDDVGLALDGFLAVASDPGATVRFTLRVRHGDGTYRWTEAMLVNRLDDPTLRGIIGNFRDVTAEREATRALRESEERFRSLAEGSPTGVFRHDAAGRCTFVNGRWQEITGFGVAEALGDGWQRIVHPDDRPLVGIVADPAPHPDPDSPPFGAERTGPFRIVRPDGVVRWVQVSTAPLQDDTGRRTGTVGALEDITARIDAERETRRLTDIFNATPDLVAIADHAGHFLYLNAAAREFFGLPDEGGLESFGIDDAFPPDVAERLRGDVTPALAASGIWYGELRVARPDGLEVPVLAQFLVHRDEGGDTEFFSGVLRDISERKDFEHRLRHQATHDPLTGLPNRTLLLDRLEHALDRSRRTGGAVAVLFLDLDHFKVVNDSLGHSRGDRLLQSLADHLAHLVRPGDTVARFGGDEFVVLCEDVGHHSAAVAIAERIIAAVAEPLVIDDAEVFIGVTVGIAISDGATDGEGLIRDADAAMYRAKERGRGRWELFDNAMRASALDRLEIEGALRRALDRRELRVHYQPIVDLGTGGIVGVEALVRWEHHNRGLLAPGEFIGVAEDTGLIVPIGAWVLQAACRQVQRWRADGIVDDRFELTVNLSGRQLGHPDLVEQVARALDETGFPADRLELEITESVLMDDVEASIATLTALRDLGVRLLVDDFGTGYSSLSYLRRFPVDGLKVDRSFVDGLGREAEDSAIVAAVITLAHTLGLVAVAEGVEDQGHLDELRSLGCDLAQGFWFARPQTPEATADRLADRPRW